MSEVQSPCVSICFLNEDDICEGCFRTSSEITEWSLLEAEKQRQVLKNCEQRRKDSGLLL